MLFNRKIYKIENLEDNMMITEIYSIAEKLPTLIPWSDDFMVAGRNFAIGESYNGRVVWKNLESQHGILAGATGSGKSAFLRCIIHQAIQKKFNVSVLDFKGGGDYSGLDCQKVSEPEEARDLLTALIVEVRGRMEKFKEAGVSNIDEFNALGREIFVPWLLVIDEAAEILDVKPKDKTQKELYTDIDQSLRTLARISRAAGVHILFGLIRPDSNVIDGQIKNNLLFRCCGYFADPAASRC
jgi:S-DNA-T family DNA segregation ATPase FtsK/SpoIIIE